MKMEMIKMTEQFSVTEAANFREMTYNILKREVVSFELDFSGCSFIDSTGLGVLVGLYKKCSEHRLTHDFKTPQLRCEKNLQHDAIGSNLYHYLDWAYNKSVMGIHYN